MIIRKLQTFLTKNDIDAIMIESPNNRRYVTGFTGTFGCALITKEEAKFITDFRYAEQARSQAKHLDIIENRNIVDEVANIASSLNIRYLAFEEDYVSYKQYQSLKEQVDVSLVPISGVVEEYRKIKSSEEIKKIKTAAAIADKAFEKILEDIRPGVSEKQIGNKLEMYMREEGATSSGYDLIIASGFRSALPHGVASEKLIERGDMVILDFGALYEGYRSDMTRTIAVGKPGQQLEEIYKIVKEALDLGINAVKDDVSCNHVDAVIRNFIANKGYGKNFGHGSGHSFGLEIHESPYFSKKSKDILQTGMVMTIEPGIYIPDLGGVRIEDDVLVTDTGCEILTHSSKDFIILNN